LTRAVAIHAAISAERAARVKAEAAPWVSH